MAEMSDILREIREIKSTVDKVENIVEKRLIGVVEPLADEQEAIESFKKLKRNRETDYVPLREIFEINWESSTSISKDAR